MTSICPRHGLLCRRSQAEPAVPFFSGADCLSQVERPAPVELHLVVFIDRRPLAIMADPTRRARLLDLDLKPLRRLAPFAVANPDGVRAIDGHFDRLRGDGAIVVGPGGDGKKPTFAPHVPSRPPSPAPTSPNGRRSFSFRACPSASNSRERRRDSRLRSKPSPPRTGPPQIASQIAAKPNQPRMTAIALLLGSQKKKSDWRDARAGAKSN